MPRSFSKNIKFKEEQANFSGGRYHGRSRIALAGETMPSGGRFWIAELLGLSDNWRTDGNQP